jgi:DNA invertase Pin-like site-specific DNA recombinase
MGRKPRDVGLTTEELVRRYRAGETVAMLAAATGVSRTPLYRRLKGAGVKPRPPGRLSSAGGLGATDADLVARYRAGETCKVIEAAMDLSGSAVRRRLKRAGVEMRWAGGRPSYGRYELPVAEIIDRYRAGESTRTIGRLLDVSERTVHQRLIEAGVERRRPWSHWQRARAGREEA